MRLVFMGTPQAAVPSLERLVADGHDVAAVYTQPDRPSGRGNKITNSPIKEVAIAHGIPVLQPTKIRTDETLEELRSHKADASIVVAYGRILPETFLTAFPHGAINVHFSLLPKYRGAAPVNWAIVNGENDTGVTTMQMDIGLDTGPILLQRAVAIDPTETSIELMKRLSDLGANLLSETISGLPGLTPVSQDDSRASLAPIMKRDDGVIDWSMKASEIVNRIRGFQPFPTAFSYIAGHKLTFWSAEMIEDGSGQPGQIYTAAGDDLQIYCGNDTAIRVLEVQPEGKRRMSVRDFLNGSHITAGLSFGI